MLPTPEYRAILGVQDTAGESYLDRLIKETGGAVMIADVYKGAVRYIRDG